MAGAHITHVKYNDMQAHTSILSSLSPKCTCPVRSCALCLSTRHVTPRYHVRRRYKLSFRNLWAAQVGTGRHRCTGTGTGTGRARAQVARVSGRHQSRVELHSGRPPGRPSRSSPPGPRKRGHPIVTRPGASLGLPSTCRPCRSTARWSPSDPPRTCRSRTPYAPPR